MNTRSHELAQTGTLRLLANSPFYFYQTGSRYFGTQTQESDYDFFTPIYGINGFTYNIMNWLEENGFQREGNEAAEKYNDNVTAAVYVKDNVHVQLVTNLNHKIAMQKLLFDSGVLNERVDKDVAKKLWQVAYYATTNVR